MSTTKQQLDKEGLHVGGDINVYGDFLTPGSKKEVTFTGGTHYHNAPPKDCEAGQTTAEKTPDSYMCPLEAFRQSVKALVEQKIIVSKQDFSVLYNLDEEMCLLGCSKYQDFADRVRELGVVPGELLPNADSVRAFSFGSSPYPDWDYTGIKTSTSHIRAVANGYLREMKRRGYEPQNVVRK